MEIFQNFQSNRFVDLTIPLLWLRSGQADQSLNLRKATRTMVHFSALHSKMWVESVCKVSGETVEKELLRQNRVLSRSFSEFPLCVTGEIRKSKLEMMLRNVLLRSENNKYQPEGRPRGQLRTDTIHCLPQSQSRWAGGWCDAWLSWEKGKSERWDGRAEGWEGRLEAGWSERGWAVLRGAKGNP